MASARPAPMPPTPSAKVNDVRISDTGVVEWFDGAAWTPYRELLDPTGPTVSQVVFRGSNNGGDPR